MVINIKAKIDLGTMPKDPAAIMSALNASLPRILEYVASVNHCVTMGGELNDGEGRPAGELLVTLAARQG